MKMLYNKEKKLKNIYLFTLACLMLHFGNI